jgi:hypothetical protein
MSRLMSVTLTEQAVRDRRKTVTRRLGWTHLKPGEQITLCRKVMGRKKANGTVEPLVRITEVEIVSVRREPLSSIGPGETALEGLPDMTPDAFVEFFCKAMRCTPDTAVTRIEWRYLAQEVER